MVVLLVAASTESPAVRRKVSEPVILDMAVVSSPLGVVKVTAQRLDAELVDRS